MAPRVPPTSLEQAASQTVNKTLLKCIERFTKSHSSYEQRHREINHVSSVLFGQIPSSIHTNLTNFILGLCKLDSFKWPLWHPDDLQLDGELRYLFCDYDNLTYEEIVDLEDGMVEPVNNYAFQCSNIKLLLNALFTSGAVNNLSLLDDPWNKNPFREALISEMPQLSEALNSFSMKSQNKLTDDDRIYIDITPGKMDFEIVDVLCEHCTNLTDITGHMKNFSSVGKCLKKLEKLTVLNLLVDIKQKYYYDDLRELNGLLFQSRNMKILKLEFLDNDNTNEFKGISDSDDYMFFGERDSFADEWCLVDSNPPCNDKLKSYVRDWSRSGAVLHQNVHFRNKFAAIDFEYLTCSVPNLVEINIQWGQWFKNHVWDPEAPSAPSINETILVLSTLRLETITINDFQEINPCLMELLKSQSDSLTTLILLRMQYTSLSSILVLNSTCPKLHFLEFSFKRLSTENIDDSYDASSSPAELYFPHLKGLAVGSKADNIHIFAPGLLRQLHHTPSFVRFYVEHCGIIEVSIQPTYVSSLFDPHPSLGSDDNTIIMSRFILKQFQGNADIEVLDVQFNKMPTSTIGLLMNHCPKLKEVRANEIHNDLTYDLSDEVQRNNLDFKFSGEPDESDDE